MEEVIAKLRRAGPSISLFVVAFLWGTYGTVMRIIYSDPGAPTPAVLTTLRSIISAAVLFASIRLRVRSTRVLDRSDSSERLAASADNHEVVVVVSPRYSASKLAFLRRRTQSIVIASVEVGVYAALGTLAHAWGLSRISAITAAFLVQSSSIITPAIALAAGEHVHKPVWIATLVSIIGTILIFVDGLLQTQAAAALAELSSQAPTQDSLATSDPGNLAGKLSIIAAAFFYSLGTYRISQLAAGFNTIEFAAGQSICQAGFSVLPALPDFVRAAAKASGPLQWIGHVWPSWHSPAASVPVLWVSLGPGAAGFVLQTFAQSTVSAPVSQVAYTATPVWSAALAYLVLHEQPFHWLGWSGAALIVAAGFGLAFQ